MDVYIYGYPMVTFDMVRRQQDAVYPLSQKDADGDKYNGAEHKYVIHFEKGQLPPVDAFWSLTMYDTKFFFVPNTINRYALSERNAFLTNLGACPRMPFWPNG